MEFTNGEIRAIFKASLVNGKYGREMLSETNSFLEDENQLFSNA